MRHGEAASIAGDDSHRPLTENGWLETAKMGQWLSGYQTSLNDVFVSPYLRAQQTCDRVMSVLSKAQPRLQIKPETLSFITPSGDAKQTHDFIDGLMIEKKYHAEGVQAILFVSHMPFVSYLVAELITTKQMPIFSTGAIAIIDYDIEKMQGQLVEMVSPTKITY